MTLAGRAIGESSRYALETLHTLSSKPQSEPGRQIDRSETRA
jgi:hypothetical protein